MLTFLEVGFGGNLVQGFRAYAWRAVPSFPQIALWGPSFAFWPQPFGRIETLILTFQLISNSIFNYNTKLFGPLCLPICYILWLKMFLATVKILVSCPVLSTLWGARWSHQDKLGELGDTPWPQGRLLPIMRSTFWSRKYLWQTKTMRDKHFWLSELFFS